MADTASVQKSGKVVIKNIGLLLSGDIDNPVLSADTIVVNDGLIVAVGSASDCDTDAPVGLGDGGDSECGGTGTSSALQV